MEPERRRIPRYTFGGVVELTADAPRSYVIAKTTELSRLGCFVLTGEPLPVGTQISLKISYNGDEFNASGNVLYAVAGKGVGIRFASLARKDQILLEEWLAEPRV
jgi:hypothetical protein